MKPATRVAAACTSQRSAAESGCIDFFSPDRCRRSEVRVSDSVSHHQVHRSTEQTFEVFLEAEIGTESVTGPGGELDEKIHIAALGVETRGRDGSKNRKTTDTVRAARPSNGCPVERNGNCHGRSLPSPCPRSGSELHAGAVRKAGLEPAPPARPSHSFAVRRNRRGGGPGAFRARPVNERADAWRRRPPRAEGGT